MVNVMYHPVVIEAVIEMFAQAVFLQFEQLNSMWREEMEVFTLSYIRYSLYLSTSPTFYLDQQKEVLKILTFTCLSAGIS